MSAETTERTTPGMRRTRGFLHVSGDDETTLTSTFSSRGVSFHETLGRRLRGGISGVAAGAMGDLADVGDAFDAALNLEESHLDEGWEEGLRCVQRARQPAMARTSTHRRRAPSNAAR